MGFIGYEKSRGKTTWWKKCPNFWSYLMRFQQQILKDLKLFYKMLVERKFWLKNHFFPPSSFLPKKISIFTTRQHLRYCQRIHRVCGMDVPLLLP
jgi:hypothetical protein